MSKSTLDPEIRYRTWCIHRPDDRADAERKVTVQEAPFVLRDGEPLRLQIFLDHSILEVFANGSLRASGRSVPASSASLPRLGKAGLPARSARD